MEELKIKPCPFCGGKADVLERYRKGTPNRKMFWVECTSCGISQAHHDLSGYRTPNKAVERWNRRFELDDIIAEIESARSKDKLCEYPYVRCINIIKKAIGYGEEKTLDEGDK